MLPDEEVVDGDVAELRLGAVGSQQAQPVLCGDDVFGVDGGFGQIQNVQELLQLTGAQRVNVLPHNGSSALVTVQPRPAEFTLAAVIPSKVTCSKDNMLIHIKSSFRDLWLLKCPYDILIIKKWDIYNAKFGTHLKKYLNK